jgi:hypothetical protein
MSLPTDPKARKALPVCTGVLDYFPDAIAAVAAVSKIGNDQHNPGEELHWSRGKSQDHADTAMRHIMERGTLDTDGTRHSAKAAWRVLALLQEELEAAGAEMSRGSRIAPTKPEPVYQGFVDLPGVGFVPTCQLVPFFDYDPADLPIKINCGDPMCLRCYPPSLSSK